MDASLTYETLIKALTSVPDGIRPVGFLVYIQMLIVSSISALYTSFLYAKFFSARDKGSDIHRAFPLLAISVTALFLCIQFSLPLSLGLLGALSIVRFRTPIKEPEEIGFIMLVIATSISVATFNVVFAVFLLAVATGLLYLTRVYPKLLPGVKTNPLLILSGSGEGFDWSQSKELLDEFNIAYSVRNFNSDQNSWSVQLNLQEVHDFTEFAEAARKHKIGVNFIG